MTRPSPMWIVAAMAVASGASLAAKADVLSVPSGGGRLAAMAAAAAPGLYADSKFYPAKGSFHLLNTCNTWTGAALAAAGFEIGPPGTVQAEALMQKVRALNGSNEPTSGGRRYRP